MAPRKPDAPPVQSSEPAAAATLHIGLFFDGTRNNADNRAAADAGYGAASPPVPLPVTAAADDASLYRSRPTSSQGKAQTNIARLHAIYADGRRAVTAQPALAIYVEGTGTRAGQQDDLIGLAFGIGATGVRAKTDRALAQLLPAALAALAQQGCAPLVSLQVDLFGFSRGAASARDAANRLRQWSSAHWQGLLRDAGLIIAPAFTLPDPVINFVGLFDTVLAMRGGDVRDAPRMQLDQHSARKVLHLIARDEHRHHFPLTSVAPEHEERSLPGAHADIGGGHDDTQEGPKLLTRPRSQRIAQHRLADFAIPDRAWLQATASHREAERDAARWRDRLGLDTQQISVDTWHQWVHLRQAGSRSALPAPTLHVYSAVVLKRDLDWRYQLIPLRVMHAVARDAGVPWRGSPDDRPDWALPLPLQAIAATLLGGGTLDAADEVLLRRGYLLQSAHWNFDVLGDTALAYASDAGLSELPYKPGPGLFYINRPTADGHRVILANA